MPLSARTCRRYSQRLRRLAGSRPDGRLVQEQHLGRWIRLRMISSLRRIPPENVLIGLKISSSMPSIAGSSLDLLAVGARHQPEERAERVQAVQDGVEADVLLGRQVQVEARLLEDDADLAARTAAACRTASWPPIATCPAVGASVVVRIEIVVVLPAPLGPSSAKNSPGCTVKEMPSTAFVSAFW